MSYHMSQNDFKTMLDIFVQSTERFATRPLFGEKQNNLWVWQTYAEFGKSVRKLRSVLGQAGITQGDRVAIISDNRPAWAIAAYATYAAGGAFVPMYEAQRATDWVYILKDSESKILFVADGIILEKLLPALSELPALERIVVIRDQGSTTVPGSAEIPVQTWESFLNQEVEELPLARVEPKNLAGIIYTSGTTGNPKGVVLSHHNIASNVSSIQGLFPISSEDRTLSFLPWTHAFGHTAELHMMMSVGASMAMAESIDRIVQNLTEVRPTVLISVPRIFNRIHDGVHKKMQEEQGIKRKLFEAAMENQALRHRLKAEGKHSAAAELKHKFFDKVVFSKIRDRFGGRLRFSVSGGAALSKEVAQFIQDLGIVVYEGYGLSECSPVVSVNWPGAQKIGSIGKAIPGVTVKILTPKSGSIESQYDEANPGVTQGEIVVYGPNVMEGYYKLPIENADVFTQEPERGLHTGDMGYIDSDGFIFITGRIKEQYKLENGKYVVPSVLEERLKLSPYITNAAVFGDGKPFNVAVIVIDADAARTWAERERLNMASAEAVLEDNAFRQLIDEQIKNTLGDQKIYERVRGFVLTTEDFNIQNDMLTPSLKVKRRVVWTRYGQALEALYKS